MSKMIEVKTADLIGPALDWAVAQAEGVEVSWRYGRELVKVHDNGGIRLVESVRSAYSPSTNWSQGGPLIEKYKLDLGAPMEQKQGPWNANTEWGHPFGCKGETPLIAACRAVVASKLGDVVQVPSELLEGRAV